MQSSPLRSTPQTYSQTHEKTSLLAADSSRRTAAFVSVINPIARRISAVHGFFGKYFGCFNSRQSEESSSVDGLDEGEAPGFADDQSSIGDFQSLGSLKLLEEKQTMEEKS